MTNSRAILILGFTFMVLGSLFTLSPELLSHSPVGFERRGVVHHIWHYVVLIGGLSIVIGVQTHDRPFEVAGLIGCGAAVLLNLAASATAGDGASLTGGVNPSISGFGVALRVIVLAWIVLRVVEIFREDR